MRDFKNEKEFNRSRYFMIEYTLHITVTIHNLNKLVRSCP